MLTNQTKIISTEPAEVTHRTGLICAAAFLTCVGLLAIYASSSIPAAQSSGNEFLYVQKQALVAAFGFLLIFATGHLPFSWIERLTLPMLALSLVLLCLVHVPGLEGRAKGASRWILLFGVTIQPAEFAKLAMVLFLAKNLSRKNNNPSHFASGVLPNFLVLGIFGALLLVQPDFGTTFLLLALTLLMLFAAGLSRKMLVWFSLAGLAGVVGAVIAAPYRLRRLLVFLDPWADAQASGFQIIQSYVGFQNGGFWGAGLGESKQKLFFLPEAHTDFILSVIGEELGLLGVLLICTLFIYIVFLGWRITFIQKNTYRRFLAFGLTAMIGLQAAINIGVTFGVLPTKGITLPFVSNGANSLLVFLIAIAILARISQEVPRQPRESTA